MPNNMTERERPTQLPLSEEIGLSPTSKKILALAHAEEKARGGNEITLKSLLRAWFRHDEGYYFTHI